jgi:hypothetical protein
MIILFWIVVSLLILFVLMGLWEWLGFFSWSWYAHGKMFTLFILSFVLLLCTPAITKQYAPQYFDYSVISIYLYVIGFLIYRFGFKKNKDREESAK